MERIEWAGVGGIASSSFICGYCGNPIASEKGWQGKNPFDVSKLAYIYICHLCSRPTFIDFSGEQTPGIAFGYTVGGIPEDHVEQLYEEARRATSAGCYTAAVLCCRKLLMHIAVSKGAKEKQNFADYVKYLCDQHYVPPDATDWVDHIRQKGNEANHEISIMLKEDAEELILFIEMLLKVIFEFPSVIKSKLAKPPAPSTS